MALTASDFITAYEAELKARYAWAKDEERLARFIITVAETLAGKSSQWNHRGPAVDAAWKTINPGTKVKSPSLKALRFLP